MQLHKGDVFQLKKGMRVYADIPERFAYGNRQLSMKQTETDIVIGWVMKASPLPPLTGIADRIIDAASWDDGMTLPKSDVLALLEKVRETRLEGLPKQFDTSIYIGEYVVTDARMEGGGTGMGPGDVYPDGWRIIARKLNNEEYDPKGLRISFYQSGCFSAMLTNIKPVRKMEQSFRKKVQ
jgi:hypothetical protein